MRPWSIVLALLLMGATCATGSGPGSSPTGSGSPTTSASPRSLPALELAVLDGAGGHLAYCDPDITPVSLGSPLDRARDRFPTIKANRVAFDAILQHEHLSAAKRFSPGELIAMNEDYKQMQAIGLEPSGEGYSFSVLIPMELGVSTWRLSGTVSPSGSVSVQRREADEWPVCPVCLAAGVRIATPTGDSAVQDLLVGMRVWTTDPRGRRIAGVVLETGHMEAPLGHEVVRLSLADGRTVVASPGHPTADGRTVRDLQPGDRYDGSVVAGTTLVPYVGATWDLLPSGPTGTYFANGVLLGSTLLLARVPAAAYLARV